MKKYLPKHDLESLQDSMYAGEWGLSFENILGAVVEDNLPFPPAALSLAEKLARDMQMEGDRYHVTEALDIIRRRNMPSGL